MAAGSRFHEPFPNKPLAFEGGVVPENWLDYNDHMNVGYYALAFDQALEPWYEEWFDFGGDYVRRAQMGPFALQSQIFYLREMRRDDRYEMRLQILEVDAKRWRLFMSLQNLTADVVAATCEQVSVCVDLSARKSAPLPEPQRSRLADMAAAHAGLPWPEQAGRGIGLTKK